MALGGGEDAFAAAALAAALAPLSRLEFLHVNNSHLLEPAGEEALTAALARAPRLRALSLAWGLFDHEAGLPLTLNLEALSRVRALSVADTAAPWGARDARPLARRLRRLQRRLRIVNLPAAWCDAAAVSALHAVEPALQRVAVSRVSAATLVDMAIAAAVGGRDILKALGVHAADVPRCSSASGSV